MTERSSSSDASRIRWRLLAVATAASAMGLGVLGVWVAFRQVQSVNVRLMSQTQLRARQVAATAEARFAQQRERVVAVLQSEHCAGSTLRPTRPMALPSWIDGLFRWDGTTLVELAAPVSSGSDLQGRIRDVLVGTAAAQADRAVRPVADLRPVLITTECASAAQETSTLIARVHPPRLRAELVQPLLDQDDDLELVSAHDASSPWSHGLSGRLNRWSLQPSAAFLQEQETLVFGQTLTYVALTALALLALLVAMWLLARAAKRDMALAQLKSNFVADVSHELKTPLAVIRLYAETLQSGRPLDETKRMEYYTVIERESTRLTNLIDNILDFARIEAGRQAYRFRPTDIAAVVRERYDAYRGQLDHQGFIHRLSIAESLPPVHADPEAIGQALLNLISNAVKYSADEKFLAVKVTADTRRDRQGVVISVEDHGIGISAADRARVFEGFFRADDGRVHLRGGTGLGLALVKNIVDAHGGVLSVESRLVKGTAFRLFLPAGRQGGAEQIAGSPDEAENVEPAGE